MATTTATNNRIEKDIATKSHKVLPKKTVPDKRRSKKQLTEELKEAQTEKKTAKKKASASISTIIIPPPRLGNILVKIVGISPLVTHNFSDKGRWEMLQKQMMEEGRENKEPRCPEEEFLQAFYWMKGSPPKPKVDPETQQRTYDPKVVAKAIKNGVFGQPAAGLGRAMVSAGRNTGIAMTLLNQAGLWVRGEDKIDPDMIRIDSKALPIMDARIVRLSGAGNVPMERFRPRWNEWSCNVNIQWSLGMLSQTNLINLLANAGLFVGLCEGRPEKKSMLNWGKFVIDEMTG